MHFEPYRDRSGKRRRVTVDCWNIIGTTIDGSMYYAKPKYNENKQWKRRGAPYQDGYFEKVTVDRGVGFAPIFAGVE